MTTIAERTRDPRILLIEDNRGDFVLLQRAFARLNQNVDIIVANTGEMALAALERESTTGLKALPDLILLDLNLPSMHGHDFLKRVKEDTRVRHIPILVLSSSTEDIDVFQSYANHANGHMAKPCDMAGYEAIAECINSCWFGLMHLSPHTAPKRRFG
jgi:CheY-like chemotaxis protein